MDKINNLINSLKNAMAVHKEEVFVDRSKMILSILKVLQANHMIGEVSEAGRSLRVKLLYFNGLPLINNFKRISKPSLRQYQSFRKMDRPFANNGFYVVSTNQGVICSKTAISKQIGGEVIMKVW